MNSTNLPQPHCWENTGPAPLWPFGPQNRWSILLGERELLLSEIERGWESLQRLRRDLPEAAGKALDQGGTQRTAGPGLIPELPTPQSLEAFFRERVSQLEARLRGVTQELEAEPPNGNTGGTVEESTLALLRAVG